MGFIYHIFGLFDFILFFMAGVSVLYLFIFSLAGSQNRSDKYPHSRKKNRFLVLIPAYNEGEVIFETAGRFLQQEYPADLYDVVVISDHISDEVNEELSYLPITLLKPEFDHSTKAKSLNYAMQEVGNKKKYDIVIILDADNNVDTNFLSVLNDTYEAGSEAIQAHRRSKNLDTETAVLDAISEEINNTIFRMGHTKLGFSSALIGSGMAIDYEWFKANIYKLKSVGEDKELEYELLQQNVYVEYLDDLYVYDEKVKKDAAYTKQRRRWLTAQFQSLSANIKHFLPALISGNFDLADKILQWMLIPRTLLVGLIVLLSIALPVFSIDMAFKWWGLLFMLILTFAIAVPNYLIDENFDRMVFHTPVLIIKQIMNIVLGERSNGHFLHTEHTVSGWDAKIALGTQQLTEEELQRALAEEEKNNSKSYRVHLVIWLLGFTLFLLGIVFIIAKNSMNSNYKTTYEKTVCSPVISGNTEADMHTIDPYKEEAEEREKEREEKKQKEQERIKNMKEAQEDFENVIKDTELKVEDNFTNDDFNKKHE